MSLDYERGNVRNAKRLRKDATPQEKRLWYDFLASYPVRFQRQKSIGRYIADFYCHRARLVIELDGAQHYTEEARKYDEERSAALAEQGVQVLRILNGEVDNNFDGVCRTIEDAVEKRIKEG